MAAALHPAAADHLPIFITPPGQTDVLLVVMVVFLLLMIFLIGLLYLRLHALPEHMAHGASKTQLQLVAVLALIALFTHNHLFWIAGLLLALVKFPDFSSPMNSMANSLRQIAGSPERPPEVPRAELPEPPAEPQRVDTEPETIPIGPGTADGTVLSERRA